MAAIESTKGTAVRAVGYLRRSTEKQEQSLEDQRREIERYAARHDFAIVRWFQDDGISGDDTERRAGFQAMHAAACNGRDFDAILCWDQDRFGRFNSLEAGYWIHPLIKAGVRLVTVNEGPVNWHDFTGRMMYAMKQEGKHQFLVDLSRNTARGQITVARSGFLNGQRAPYGFDRMLVNERGEHVQRIADGEKIARPKSWKVTLVLSDDPVKVDTVKWLFDSYANTDTGIRQLAEILNAKGIAGPNGGTWWLGTIREILRNPAYTGDLVWARRRIGKYHRVAAGDIRPRTDGAKVRHNAPEEWIVVRDAHAAIVDRDTWKQVQKKLAKRHDSGGRRSRASDRYLLSGLIFCGHCGRRMHGTIKSRQKRGKRYTWEKYICSTYANGGKVYGCGYHTVDQRELLAFLLTKLRDAVLAGGHREKLREKIIAQLRERQKSDPAHVKQLEVKLAELDRQLKQGTERLLKSPEDITDLLAPQLSEWRKERDRLAAETAAHAREAGPRNIEAEADAAVDRLWTLADELDHAEPSRVREVIRRMVGRIELWFDHVPHGKRVECPLSKGTIELRPDQIFFGQANRGDRIRTCDFMVPNQQALPGDADASSESAEGNDTSSNAAAGACTAACTSEVESGHGQAGVTPGGNLEAIAAELRRVFAPADLAKLVAALLGVSAADLAKLAATRDARDGEGTGGCDGTGQATITAGGRLRTESGGAGASD